MAIQGDGSQNAIETTQPWDGLKQTDSELEVVRSHGQELQSNRVTTSKVHRKLARTTS